jgi:hypothetical protein
LKFKKATNEANQKEVTAVGSNTTATGRKSVSGSKDFRMLVTTLTLTGWTFMGMVHLLNSYLGWSCLLMVFFYELFTGIQAPSEYMALGAVGVVLCISGDTIIVLALDRRWNTAAKDLIAKFKK